MATWTIFYKHLDTAWFLLLTMPSFIARLLIKETQKNCNEEENSDGKSWSNSTEHILLFLLSITSSFIVRLLIRETRKICLSTSPLAKQILTIIGNKDVDVDDDDEEEKEEEEHAKRYWSGAPDDILLLIKSRLTFVDQVQFGAVCGGWNSVPDTTSCIDKLPWLLNFRQDPCLGVRVCGLYDPSTEKTYRIDHQLLKLDGDKEFQEWPFGSSKHGWVFLIFISPTTRECKAILFHAFSMETIHLPELKVDDLLHYEIRMVTFSTIPTSSNCVLYFVMTNFEYASGEMLLFTYRNGDETWNFVKLSPPPNMRMGVQDIICMNNLVHFAFDYGEIWAFDIEHEEEWGRIPIDCSAVEKTDKLDDYKLVEYDGEILLVGFVRRYRIFKIDWSRKAWVEQFGLSNVALFLGNWKDSGYAVSVTSDYDNEKINSLSKYMRIKFYGDGRDFFFIHYQGGAIGLEDLVPECDELIAWVRPH